jgi:ZIP family zinc transporter
MPQWFMDWHPVQQALLATTFTWGVTALGAAVVFFFNTVNRKTLDAMLGFAAGIMIAASFWSLLAPAIAMTEAAGGRAWVAAGVPEASMGGALALALGIGIQNFPEGLAVAAPLRREGWSRRKSFMYGQASGIVEPIAGVIGAAAVLWMRPILPYALSFAAGAMIYVVVEELIPESQLKKNTDLATIGAMLGFALMMALDVALG